MKGMYEIGYHLVSTLGEDELGAEVAKIREAIESRGGSVSSEEWPKVMSLAYSISRREDRTSKTYDSAYFGWVRFEVSSDQVKDLQEAIDSISSVLRFIIVAVEKERSIKHKKRSVQILKPAPVTDEEKSEETVVKDEESEAAIDREIDKLMAE